ncbi:hypothetical protein HCA69_15440 [Listeria grandensis]|uniref:Uncharacterized protein n=1 Tax=Listeria grandensis TaxID=1494963 RepID=A0A7X1CR71_9LIST|nr:hypothetical protein [Listeria grandensis]MBC1937762.1 hypothetical protein [Listeria grandensis]
MVNNCGYNVCFSQYDNASLRIDLASETFELLLTCTTETNEIEDFENIRGCTEAENDEFLKMHAYNLIIAINTKHQFIIRILSELGVIHAKPSYLQLEGEHVEDFQMVAFYALTNHGIEQKCKIIDEEDFQTPSLEDMEGMFRGVEDIEELDKELVYQKKFLYKRKIASVEESK